MRAQLKEPHVVGGQPPCTQTMDSCLSSVDSYEYFQSWSPCLKKDSLCDPFGPQSPIALAQVKVDFAWDYILSQLFPFLHSASLSSRLHQELDSQHITFTGIFSGSAFREPKPLTSQSL